MDRKLILGALALFILQVLWLLDDMKLISLFHRSKTELHSQQAVGTIVTAQKDVKRRSLDSFVWEDSQARDQLYYFDSVLTLKQSGATLQIEGDTKIALAENTLVVLEPSSQKNVDRLRLVFSKGDMRASSAHKPGEYLLSTWTVEAEKGSEVHVRAQNDGRMNVELLQGKAQLVSSDRKSTQPISQGKLVTLSAEAIEKVETVTKDLKWSEDKKRVYVQQLPAKVNLDWDGEADKILVHPLQGTPYVLKPTSPTTFAGPFEAGDYELRLSKGGAISQAMTLQVWKAPIIHLMYPFARDRLDIDLEQTFSWSHPAGVDSFEFQMSETEGFENLAFEKATRAHLEKLKTRGLSGEAYFWRVSGRDSDGFAIPPAYSLPVYLVDDPLAAPKLKPIKIRKPAGVKKHQSSLWKYLLKNLLVSTAHAEIVRWEVDFGWEPVPGADQYVIEISDQPNFQTVLKSHKVKKPEYTWQYEGIGAFYWRVAAEKGSGKLGLFSDPQKFSVDEASLRGGDDDQGVVIRKIVTQPPLVPSPTPTPTPPPAPPPVPEAENPDPEIRSSVWIGPAFEYLGLKGSDQTQAKGMGMSLVNFGTSIYWPLDKKYGNQITLRYGQSTWKPQPADNYPFQEALKDWSARGAFYFRKYQRAANFGLAVNRVSELQRDGLEAASLKGHVLGGPAVYWDLSHILTFDSAGEWTLTGDGKLYELALMQRMGWALWDPRETTIVLGIQANVFSYYGPAIPFGYRLQGLIYLGFSF